MMNIKSNTRFLLSYGVILLFLVVAAINLSKPPAHATENKNTLLRQGITRAPKTLLLIDSNDVQMNNIQPSTLRAWTSQPDIQILGSVGQLETALQNAVVGDSVYLSSKSLNTIRSDWLKQKYAQGVAFAVFNTSLSVLQSKVGTSADVAGTPDLNPSSASGRISIAVCQEAIRLVPDDQGFSIGLPNQPKPTLPPVPEKFGFCYTDYVENQTLALKLVAKMVHDSSYFDTADTTPGTED